LLHAVLFDYGGTLVTHKQTFDQVRPAAKLSVYTLLKGAGLTLTYDEFLEVTDATFKKYSSIERERNQDISDSAKYQEIINTLFPAHSPNWRKKIARQATNEYWKVIVRNYPLRKNTRRTLTKLRSMNVEMAVVSNHHYHEALVKHLQDLGIAENFVSIFSSEKSGIRKPDVRIFEACMAAMGTKDPKRVAFVGDSLENDIAGAKSVGLHTILITGDADSDDLPKNGSIHSDPDFIIDDIAQLPKIVLSL
jgi:putative hydrolase of the HAD superfamily